MTPMVKTGNTGTRTRRRSVRLLGVRIDWFRHVHTYHDGSTRFVNQFHFIRDRWVRGG